MYSLNNIPLSNWGITPGKAQGSNIALTGMLDMPPRIGKLFHDWTGEAGVEPYVLASEIRHGGRQLTFTGLLEGGDRTSASNILRNFYRELLSFKGRVAFETPWGTYQVYIKNAVEGEYLNSGWCSVEIDFEEPVVSNDGNMVAGVVTDRPHIDGVALDSLGIYLSASKGHLNRPQTKDQEFTAYQYQGYQVTPPEALGFELELFAYAANYDLLKSNLKSLQKLLSSPGLHRTNFDGNLWEVFNVKGFEVTDLKISDNFAVCKINLPLMQGTLGKPVEIGILVDNEYNRIVNNLNELIQVNI